MLANLNIPGNKDQAELALNGMMNLKDQLELLDNSLTNLFDSMKKPLVHENKFDLTQKINENFKDILQSINTQMQVESQAAGGNEPLAKETEDNKEMLKSPSGERDPQMQTPCFVGNSYEQQDGQLSSRKVSKKKHFLYNEYPEGASSSLRKKYIKEKSDKKKRKKKKENPYP